MATNDVWTGNGNWTGNPTDWSLEAPPTAAETAEIDGNATLSSAVTPVAGVTVDANSTLYITSLGALTDRGAFTNNGVFDVDSNGKRRRGQRGDHRRTHQYGHDEHRQRRVELADHHHRSQLYKHRFAEPRRKQHDWELAKGDVEDHGRGVQPADRIALSRRRRAA